MNITTELFPNENLIQINEFKDYITKYFQDRLIISENVRLPQRIASFDLKISKNNFKKLIKSALNTTIHRPTDGSIITTFDNDIEMVGLKNYVRIKCS